MKIFNKKLLGLAISVVFIWLIATQVDIKETLKAFKEVTFVYLPFIIPIYYLSFLIRSFRWRLILTDNNLRIRSLISSIFIGFTANCLLPARMGEFYRAHIFGKKENIKRAKVFASIVLERILDGTVLFLILLALIYFIYSKPWLFKLAFVVGVIFIGGFIALLLCARYRYLISSVDNPKVARLEEFILKSINRLPQASKGKVNKAFENIKYLFCTFLDGLDIFNRPWLLIQSFILTFIIWMLEGTSMFLIIKSFGISIHLISAIFVLCVTAFSTMIPSGPASIGPYQYGYILSLGVFGISKEMSLAISIINQFLGIIMVSAAGLFYMWKDHINISELEKDVDLESDIPA